MENVLSLRQPYGYSQNLLLLIFRVYKRFTCILYTVYGCYVGSVTSQFINFDFLRDQTVLLNSGFCFVARLLQLSSFSLIQLIHDQNSRCRSANMTKR